MSFKIEIKTPCNKQYDELNPVDGSCRFCMDCSQKVYDFTDCTPEEFLKIYTENKGKVCGRISQKVPTIEQKRSKYVQVKYWLMSFLAFLGVTSCSFFNDPEEIHVLGDIAPLEIIDTAVIDTGEISTQKL